MELNRNKEGKFARKWKVKGFIFVVFSVALLTAGHFYVEPWIDVANVETRKFLDSMSNEVVAYADAVKIVEKDREFPKALQVICNAESGGKHFKDDGRVARGHVNPSDIGMCQINEPIWNDRARELGFDIFTEQGNKDMAMWLFDNYGTEPWNASKPVWIKKLGH